MDVNAENRTPTLLDARTERVRPWSLQAKVSLFVVLPMLVILGLSTYVEFHRHRERDLASMSLVAAQTGEIIEQALKRDMLLADFDAVQSTVDAIGVDSRVRALFVMKTDGQVVFSPEGRAVGQILNNQEESCQPCHSLPPGDRPSGVVVTLADGQPVFRSMQPIENEPECTQCHQPNQRLNGLLLTDLSIAPVEAALATDVRDNLAWWSSALLVNGVFASFAVNRLVLRRLRKLSAAIEGMAKLDPTKELPEWPPDEIGRLSAVFNTMAARVRERNLQNVALSQALRDQAEERGQLLERLIAAQEEERKRVARELHDELGQGMGSTALSIELAQRALETDARQASQHLDQANSMVAEAIDRMYDLIRGLRPTLLDELGLEAALRAHARQVLDPAGVSFEIQARGLDGRLPSMLETALFRIFQEAITNILRHANASNVRLRLDCERAVVDGEIQDDGVGFEVGELGGDGRKGRGLGLLGMRERAAQLGGEVEFVSEIGLGTKVVVRIPVGEVEDVRDNQSLDR